MDNISIQFAAAPLVPTGLEGARLFTAMKGVRMSDKGHHLNQAKEVQS